MKKIKYVTGNIVKFNYAKNKLKNIELEQVKVEIDELQTVDKEKLAVDKAKKSYEIIREPILITDTFWEIEVLNNFPGPFMHYVNKWFSEKDFLNLMQGQTNRNVKATDTIVYFDGEVLKIWTEVFSGKVSETAFLGETEEGAMPSDRVMNFEGKYICELQNDWAKITPSKKAWSDVEEFLLNI